MGHRFEACESDYRRGSRLLEAVKEVQEKVAAAFDIAPLGSEAFDDYVRGQMAIWKKLVQETGIKPE